MEDFKKKLAILKKENESIKIDEITVKFFEKRNIEEDALNKIDLLVNLETFMTRRKETNDFFEEEDIKAVREFKVLILSLHKSVAFKNKIWPPLSTRVVLFGGKKRSTNTSISVTPT